MATAGIGARHSHLLRAAQCAREAFADAVPEEGRRASGRSPYSIAVWLGLGALASLIAYVAS